MHFLQTLFLGLAATQTATAIDIYLHTLGNREGNAVVCRGINPDVCCGGSNVEIFPTVAFRGIPTSWTLSCRGHNGGYCQGLREVLRAANTNWICLRDGWFSGGGYSFTSFKRGAAVDAAAELAARNPADACPADAGGCKSFVKPNLLQMQDGAEYDIADLEGEALQNLLAIAVSGANSTAIPEEFDALKISQ